MIEVLKGEVSAAIPDEGRGEHKKITILNRGCFFPCQTSVVTPSWRVPNWQFVTIFPYGLVTKIVMDDYNTGCVVCS